MERAGDAAVAGGRHNVLNIIDGPDGLAAGMTSIAALPMLFIAPQREQWAVGPLAAALIGSTLGFLRC